MPEVVSIDHTHEKSLRIEPLREDLRSYIKETKKHGLCIRHPFCNQPIHDLERCALIHEQIDRRTARADACFEAGDYEGYLGCVEAALQIQWLEKDASLFDHDQYWRLLRTAYDNQEHTVGNRKRLERLLRVDRPGRDHLMNVAERKALAQLPQALTIYRGHGYGRYGRYGHGIAWTLHKPAAIWYAHAYEPTRDSATVLVGRILRQDLYAYCDGGDVLVKPPALDLQWAEDVSHIKEAQAAWDDYVPEFDLAAYLKSVG